MGYAEKEICDFMRESVFRPVSIKELVRVLRVPMEERNEFKKLIKDMVAEGTLVKIRGGRYGLPSKLNLVSGRLQCHPDGYGFVIPEEGEGDVFIGPRKFSGAMNGDRVVARVEGYKDRGRREGRIIRILERAHSRIVGRFETARNFSVVVPSDERVLDRVIIPPGETGGAGDGVIVEVEITRWPSRDRAPAGRVVEVIGDPEDPDVESDVILRKYGLPVKFPPEVAGEVREIPMSVDPDAVKGRVDLREKKIFTIDGETAKDFDDAVGIEKTAHGYTLLVSIADVSHYVKEGSRLDSEAYSRGTSVYFPDRCIPMLPEALSNGICSLNPGEDRLTLTAELTLDGSGRVTKKRFYESVIRSTERLTYTNVKSVLADEDPALARRYAHITEDLRLMRELAERLSEERFKEGGLDFDLPEPQIILDIEGRVEDIVRSERNIAHRIIEEFMLAANRAVAEEFSSRKWPFLFRVHEPPAQESVEEFREFIAGFGLHMRGGGPKAFQKVLHAVDGRPEEKLVNHVLLRSMKQAVYSEENTGHFGLAFENYTHFTSPIRRYPDLVVHRLLKLLLRKKYLKKERERAGEHLPSVASATSASERKAMEAEREIVDLKKAQFMKDKVGASYDGLVSGVTSFGLFVELKDYFVEGLVHVSTLMDDYYIFDQKRHTLTGEHTKRVFRIGEALRVVVSRVDLERRRIDLVLEETRGSAQVARGRRRPRR